MLSTAWHKYYYMGHPSTLTLRPGPCSCTAAPWWHPWLRGQLKCHLPSSHLVLPSRFHSVQNASMISIHKNMEMGLESANSKQQTKYLCTWFISHYKGLAKTRQEHTLLLFSYCLLCKVWRQAGFFLNLFMFSLGQCPFNVEEKKKIIIIIILPTLNWFAASFSVLSFLFFALSLALNSSSLLCLFLKISSSTLPRFCRMVCTRLMLAVPLSVNQPYGEKGRWRTIQKYIMYPIPYIIYLYTQLTEVLQYFMYHFFHKGKTTLEGLIIYFKFQYNSFLC